MCDFVDRLRENNYQKNRVATIATEFNVSKSYLEHYFNAKFFKEISEKINLAEIANLNIEKIEEVLLEEEEEDLIKKFRFIKTDLKKIIEKSLFIAMSNGFATNLNHINSGVMVANAGDSAEFIFVARAILAGFNCSAVDVRSSRYDAIIDYANKLLRVQIKSMSKDGHISFKDRDRGGQGIDYTNPRNRGKRITSQDCDIYVAVDKQVGLCYIIPMSWAETLNDNECIKVSLTRVSEFKENWDIVKQVADSRQITNTPPTN